MRGDSSTVLELRWIRRTVAASATFRPLLGAGHAPQSDAPDSIVRLVRQATRRTDALRTG